MYTGLYCTHIIHVTISLMLINAHHWSISSLRFFIPASMYVTIQAKVIYCIIDGCSARWTALTRASVAVRSG